MHRVHLLQNHPLYRECWEKLEQAEQERVFCRHTMEHFLDVARLMYIYNLEDGAGLPKELIYAAALLHDIGRYEQITAGTPHDIAGAGLAGRILADCGFSADEVRMVQQAILGHREEKSGADEDHLTAYLYRADKQSRSCFACPAEGDCYWPKVKKNLQIEY